MKRGMILLFLLTGCVTSQEERLALDDKQCRSYGSQPGTQAYVACRLQIDQNRANQRLVNSTAPIGLLINAAEAR